MNLRDSLRAAAREAPLAESTVDVGRIVARERRARSTRRRGAVALAGLAAVAVSVSIWYPEGHDPVRPPGIAASRGPSASASSRTTPDATPVRLTTKDFGTATLPDQGSLARIVKTGPDRHVALALYWRDASEVAARGGNPCDEAPVPEDTCVHAEVGGHSAWIRRWGYSRVYRPSMAPDVVVVQAFINTGGVLTIANVLLDPTAPIGRPIGPPFTISDEDTVTIAFDLYNAGHPK
jgi:hypothetical protein